MAVVLAVVIFLLVIGSLVFHFVSPWYFTELASNWTSIDRTVDITFIVTGIVFVLVNLFTVYCILKFRHRPGKSHRAHYEPESNKLEIGLTVGTAIGVAILLAPGLLAWGDFVKPPDDALRVEALGKQWHWSYRFPGADGEFGETDVRQMSPDNPMGLDVMDPAGQDDVIVSAPILHLPEGQAAHVLLRSTDVLHNFTVPQFRVKMDLVPGMVTYQWFRPTREGTFDVLCEELCGIGHFAMRSKVVVDSQADFDTWLSAQPTFAQTQARPVGVASRGAATYAICAACHGTDGLGNQTMNAPRIAGQQAQYIRRQIDHFKTGLRGAVEQDTYGRQMAGMAATLATPATVEDTIAYIESLPDKPAEQTLAGGDVEHGRELFTTCGLCHGENAQGNWNSNAPRLAGMSDWYLVRQLQNFKQRIRGGHPDDIYGDQMSMMASVLRDDAAINDVIAYINSLD